ncbi:MAG: serine--tRNA ligase [Alphaproteobacteria bacterium]|nr:serine--tRNA ligase [Alphaproteobacteria bacterium]
MHDIKFIRENATEFDRIMQRKGLESPSVQILGLDEKRRKLQTELQALQARRNESSKQIGVLKSSGGDADELIAEVAFIKKKIPELESEEHKLAGQINALLFSMPNLLDDNVPDGASEEDNVLLRQVGDIPKFEFKPRDHVALGEVTKGLDFEAAAEISGARFVVLSGQMAKLERALASFMLDIHTSEFGYTEYLPPALVNSKTMTGTGQLPKFEDDLFKTTDGRWLIPTAEVPLTNMVANQILDVDRLPLRMTAYTPCFRSEAGSAGRDTRGMIRQHQFSKVELVSITDPNESDAELDRMTSVAETVLNRLKLAYRVVKLCSGDTGFSARQTNDIEVWLPGQDEGEGRFREISSCSTCGPFQARRMNARFRRAGQKETEFVHTLNGSALAVGRCMVAIMENGQQKDGSILLPEALHSYMGTDKIE